MTGPERAAAELARALDDAERKAWDALARYKFWMFGYHAAQWVLLNRTGHFKRANPWRPIVLLARELHPLTVNPKPAPLLADSDREAA